MLAWFRRQRLLAALLIAANPALVGSWVAAYHPCPVRDGIVAPAQIAAPAHDAVAAHAGHDMMAMEEAPAPSDQAPAHDHGSEHGPCTCIGQCLSAGIALPSLAGDEIEIAVVVSSDFAPRTSNAQLAPASAPPYLLPPSTAPPIA